jgi:hypothetical protein
MAGRQRASFQKRERERARQEKQAAKRLAGSTTTGKCVVTAPRASVV